MLQKFLDGKKKYSAFIITVLATLIPLFVHDPETQRTILDLVPSLAAALAGIFYMVTQGKVDKEKEIAKALANGNGAAVVTATQAADTKPVESLASESIAVIPQFDPKAFHEAVMSEVEATYREINPTTIYYKARDKGQVTDCQHISQAVDYWSYLVDLAVDARDWLKETTEKEEGRMWQEPGVLCLYQGLQLHHQSRQRFERACQL